MLAVTEDTTKVVQQGAKLAETAARQTDAFKDRSGDTRKTIVASTFSTGRGTGFKLAGKGATGFQNFGTRGHVVEAKKGGYLRFVTNGTVFYRKLVVVSGIKATHFMEKAVREGALFVWRNLPIMISKSAKRLGLGGSGA